MKVLFMGTPGFALPSLEALYGKHDLLGVVTKPDRPVGRGKKMTSPPVADWARARGVPVYQPETLKDEAFLDVLEALVPDVIVVVAYGKILPKYILDYPAKGCINVHASILPKYRGAAPIQWAVINGETTTGVTIMRMDEGLDSGDIICVEETEIGAGETSGDLFERLSHIGADALITALDGELDGCPQEGEATYAPMLTKEMAEIDWTKSSVEIVNLVRGMNPAPVARAGEWKIYKACVGDRNEGGPGEIYGADKRGIEVGTGDSSIFIEEIRVPGGKRMSGLDYYNGKKSEFFANIKE